MSETTKGIDLAAARRHAGDALDLGGLPAVDEPREELRERLLGARTYWEVFEKHVPGFLDALLRLSPEAFKGFVSYGSIPA